jgi:hypothetical protein
MNVYLIPESPNLSIPKLMAHIAFSHFKLYSSVIQLQELLAWDKPVTPIPAAEIIKD